MKKNNILLIIVTVFTLILAACGGENTSSNDAEADDTEVTETEELEFEPEAINEDTDVCDVCAMTIQDNEHATQIVLQNDRSLKFDDIGCLYEWVDENGEDDIGAQFVRDFHSEEWIQLKDTTFVYDEEIQTPMAYGVISFEDLADAENYVEEEGIGEVLDASALANHEWEMNKEMMDDGDHDHDDHEDHEE